MKISVIIITLNEETKIRECLESVSWADEIILSDSESSDRTLEIAKEFTDKITVKEDWEGYGREKNLCAAKAGNDWILNVDADETVSEELKNEILNLISNGPEYAAYSVVRKNFIGDRWIRYGGWYPDRIVRLYNKKEAAFTETLVHEGVQTSGKVGTLEGHLAHKSFDSLEDYFARQERYSPLSAKEMFSSGKKARLHDLIARPLLHFSKVFVLKMGFLEGYYGLVLAYGQALYTYKKYAKLMRLSA